MKETQTKEKEHIQVALTGQDHLPAVARNELEEKIKKNEEKIKENEARMLPGKAPVRLSPIFKFSEKEGAERFDKYVQEDKIDWKEPVLREPHTTFFEALEKITATTDSEFAEEVFFRGVNAMPNIENNRVRIANTMIQTLADREPKDSIEAKLVMQESALYAQGMAYLSRAERSDMISQSDFYMKSAIKLLRLHNETVEALNKYRRGGEQKVTVQHQYVQVNDGGQAIVGQVGGGGKEKIGEVSPC